MNTRYKLLNYKIFYKTYVLQKLKKVRLSSYSGMNMKRLRNVSFYLVFWQREVILLKLRQRTIYFIIRNIQIASRKITLLPKHHNQWSKELKINQC